MVKGIISAITNTPQNTYRIAQYTDSWNRLQPLVDVSMCTHSSGQTAKSHLKRIPPGPAPLQFSSPPGVHACMGVVTPALVPTTRWCASVCQHVWGC